jgi:hypothetical protein
LKAPQWEDLRFSAVGINPPGAGTDPTRDTTDGRLIFAAAATNITVSNMMLILISRIGGDGTDTFTGTAKLAEFDIHYQIDTVGSRTSTRK